MARVPSGDADGAQQWQPSGSDSPFLARSERGFASDTREQDHASAGENASVTPGTFTVYRADEFARTSALHFGGDWRWRLTLADGETLAEAGGYPDEAACLRAVQALRREAAAPGAGRCQCLTLVAQTAVSRVPERVSHPDRVAPIIV